MGSRGSKEQKDILSPLDLRFDFPLWSIATVITLSCLPALGDQLILSSISPLSWLVSGRKRKNLDLSDKINPEAKKGSFCALMSSSLSLETMWNHFTTIGWTHTIPLLSNHTWPWFHIEIVDVTKIVVKSSCLGGKKIIANEHSKGTWDKICLEIFWWNQG